MCCIRLQANARKLSMGVSYAVWIMSLLACACVWWHREMPGTELELVSLVS